MSKKISRRKALTLIGGSAAFPLAANPVEMLIRGLVNGVLQKASAENAPNSIEPRNYIFICMPGAPPRWHFDLAMRPYSAGTALVRNMHVNNRFKNGQLVYENHPVNLPGGGSLNMPHIWQNDIPRPGAGTAPMSQLLENMLIVRGLNMQVDGHGPNRLKMIRPNPGANSLDGMVADLSSKPIPAVSTSGVLQTAYASGRGIGQVVLGANRNGIIEAMSPFRRADYGGDFLNRRDAMELSVNEGLRRLGIIAMSGNPAADGLFEMRSSAEQLLRDGVGNVGGEYDTYVAKYRDLITRVRNGTLKGVTNEAITNANLSNQKNQCRLTDPDAGANYLDQDGNLHSIISTETSVSGLAENFAVTEYLIRRGYSSALTLDVGIPTKFRASRIKKRSDDSVKSSDVNFNYTTDEHAGGSAVSVIAWNFYFTCLAACIREMIDVLDTDLGIFNESLIQLGSEFSRIPRNDQLGSDHGWMANVTSMWSGVISEPKVLGNIRPEPVSNTQRQGDWGKNAPVAELDGLDERELQMGNLASTVTEILRVESPFSNNQPVISVDESTSSTSQRIEDGRERNS